MMGLARSFALQCSGQGLQHSAAVSSCCWVGGFQLHDLPKSRVCLRIRRLLASGVGLSWDGLLAGPSGWAAKCGGPRDSYRRCAARRAATWKPGALSFLSWLIQTVCQSWRYHRPQNSGVERRKCATPAPGDKVIIKRDARDGHYVFFPERRCVGHHHRRWHRGCGFRCRPVRFDHEELDLLAGPLKVESHTENIGF